MIVLADSGTEFSLLEWLEGFGTNPWLLIPALALATFLSEDLACICGGLLAAKGWMTIEQAIIACGVGIWVGDVGLYWLGYYAANTRKHWKWMDRIASPQRIAKGRHMFEQHGMKWIFISRFVPGMRLPSFVAAGAVGWSFKKFVLALAVGAWLWVPVVCGLAYVSGRAVLEWVEAYQRWAWPIILAVGLVVWVILRLVIPAMTWRGRRILYSSWMRIRRWEYWPVWMVSPPLVLVLVWQALRFRAAAVFTACNPAIPHSGFALESKGDILDALRSPDESRVRVVRYRRLAEGAPGRLETVEAFLKEEGIGYPVVLKPDIGEHGMGVSVVRTRKAASAWLAAFDGGALVQEFVGGLEFGVQWCRRPDADHGCVPSVAGKIAQTVTGDGERTLEHLILDDRRAVMSAGYYLMKYEDRLGEVPAKSEEVVLVEIGTRARGALLTDARELVTEELQATLDALGLEYDGFYFGRYDLRVPSAADLQAGRGLVVLELNGVTGKPLHVYQPGYPWWQGMRDLGAHWRTACEIGAANRAAGRGEASSLFSLWKLIRAHRRRWRFEAEALPGKERDE